MDAPSRAFDRYRRHGDAAALGAVFDALAPRLLSLALHLCQRPAEAEDLLQETFVRAMLAADQFDAGRAVEPWLCGLMANSAQNLRRREARRRTADLDGVDEPVSGAPGPASHAERSELVATLRTRIGELPAEQRQALLLQLQHGLSPAEIAEVLAVPAGTIRMRLHRGLRALRRLLPAGLAALLGLGVEGRGLAAVRARVMARAAAPTVPVGAVLLLGAAAWQHLVAVGALLLLALGAAIALRPMLQSALPEQLPAAGAATIAASDHQVGADSAGTLDEQIDAAPQREVASGTAARRLSVHVTQCLRGEPDAMPLPGAAVTVYHRCGDRSRTTRIANATGDVTFADLEPGLWRVKVDGDACIDSVTRDADVTAADAAIEVALEFASRLHGIVVDPDGLPVADAEIWSGFCFLGRVSPLAAMGRRCAVTGPDGRFSVLVSSATLAAVSARKDGYAGSWSVSAVMRSATQDQVRLVLGDNPAAVHGVLLGAGGGPAAGATVALVLQAGDGLIVRAADGSAMRIPVPVVVTTDRLGTFTVRGLLPGTYTCWAEVTGGDVSRSLQATAFATAEVCVDASARATLRGIVRDRDGAPLAGANVVVLAGDGREVRWDTTGPDGRFGVLSVPAGPLRVQTRRGTRVAGEVSVTPGPGDSVQCELATDEHPVVAGVLVGEDGVAIAGWCVRAEVGAEVSEVLTSPDGTFVCIGSGAGPLQLRVTRSVAAPEVVLSRQDVPAGSLDLRLQVSAAKLSNGALMGRVVDDTGAPLPGAMAVLDQPIGRDFETQTGADGRFVFQRLVARDYELTLRAPRRVACSVRVAVRADAPSDLDAMRLEPAAILRVRVVRSDGGTWTGRPPTPSVRRTDGSPWSPYPVPVFDGDVVEFDSLPSGRYLLQGVTVFAEPLAIELQAGRTTSVDWPTRPGYARALRFAAGPDVTAGGTLRVSVRDHSGRELALTETPRWFDDPDGRGWVLPVVLPEGSFAVEARADSGCRYALQLRVGGEHEDPDVTIPAAR